MSSGTRGGEAMLLNGSVKGMYSMKKEVGGTEPQVSPAFKSLIDNKESKR